jgi:hypothetical protein
VNTRDLDVRDGSAVLDDTTHQLETGIDSRTGISVTIEPSVR